MPKAKKRRIRKIITQVLLFTFILSSVINLPALEPVLANSLAGMGLFEQDRIDRETTVEKPLETDISPKLIIKYKDQSKAGATRSAIQERAGANQLTAARSIQETAIEVLTFTKQTDLRQLMEQIKQDENIEYVQLDYALETMEEDQGEEGAGYPDAGSEQPESDLSQPEEDATDESPEDDLADGNEDENSEENAPDGQDEDAEEGGAEEGGAIEDADEAPPEEEPQNQFTADDPYLDLQWSLINNGQEINGTAGVQGIDINILPLWEANQETQKIKIGLVDSGLDPSHPELAGVIDTAQAWDFVNNSSNVNSGDALHATQIAGIIAATKNNQEGIAGVAANAEILPAKFAENGAGYTSVALEAIAYSIEKGAVIINCSWGSPYYSPALRDIITQHPEVLFICAAGNNASDLKIYPAAFNLPNVVSVASVNNQGHLAYTSNFGPRVITAAPGEDIYTLSPNQGYGYAGGTSMATAFATGAAALYQGLNPHRSAIDTAMVLKLGVSPLADLNGKVQSEGLLNLETMLTVTDGEIQTELQSRDFEEDENPEGLEDDPDKDHLTHLLANGITVKNDKYIGAPQTVTMGNEEVNMVTGSLTYKITDAVLPGRNGLDLVIATQYQSAQAYSHEKYYISDLQQPEQREKLNNNNIISDFATGWSFNFSSISEMCTDETVPARYVNTVDGGCYAIGALNESTNIYNLRGSYVDDTDTDLVLARDSSYINGSATSYYLLTYKDGKREYFDKSGQIMAIIDRYGNTITFNYTGKDYVQIIDTLNRSVTIQRLNISSSSRQVIVAMPDNSTVTYDIYVLPNSTTHSASGSPTNGKMSQVNSRQDQEQNLTTFAYLPVQEWYGYTDALKDSDITKNQIYFPGDYLYYLNYSYKDYGWSLYNNLLQVNHPTGAVTKYVYRMAAGKLGDKGGYRFSVLSTRADIYNAVEYNKMTYTFGGQSDVAQGANESYEYDSYTNFTGYPYLKHFMYPTDAPSFSYKTSVIESKINSTGIEGTYNYKNQKVTETIKKRTSMSSEPYYQQTAYEYGANNYRMPVKATETRYTYSTDQANPPINGGPTGVTTTKYYSYDNTLNLTGYWDTQASSNSDAEHKTQIDYTAVSNPYNIPLTKTYKKDSATTIKEENVLTSDKKSIAEINVYENNVLKKQIKNSSFDAYGNVTQSKEYIDANNFITTDYTYNQGAYLATETVGGVTHTYTYDTMGRLLTYTEPEYQGTNQKYEYLYDDLGRVTEEKYPDGNKINYTYNDTANTIDLKNEKNQTTKYYYNPLGWITKVVTPLGLNEAQFEYDFLGRVTKEIDGEGNYATYQYDYQSRKKQEVSYNAAGTVVGQIDHIYYTNYNDAQTDRVKTTVTGDVNSPDIVTAVETNKHGYKTKDIRFQGGTELVDIYTNDYLGNVTQVLSASDAALGRAYTHQYQTDIFGQVTVQTNKTVSGANKAYASYDWLGRKTNATDPNGNTTNYAYDSLSRLITEQTPLDVTNYITKSYTYDDNNNLTESKISNNLPGQAASQRKVGYEYDNRNRLVKVNNYEANAIESYIQYEYDAAGNMTAQKTGNGAKITAYAYDNDNRLTSTTDPLNQVESYTYYDNNNLETKTDRNGQISTYTYDGAGKLLTTVLVSPTGNITKANTYSKTGNLTQQSEQGAQISYQYDNLGRLTNVTDPDGITKVYTYNLNDQPTSFQLKQNSVEKLNLAYTYDALDRLSTVKEGATQIAGYSYDQNGNQTNQTFNNGTSSNYTYNKANQILTLSNQKGAAILSGYAYQYYTDGNAYKITDNDNIVTTYLYDGMGRLTSETFGTDYTKTYTYDTANNRSSMAVTGANARTVAYVYDDNNRLTKETSVGTGIKDEYRYAYDPNGNQIAKTKGNIESSNTLIPPAIGVYLLGGPVTIGDYEAEVATYDGFNRLTQIKNNGQTIDYAYRPDDLRRSKTVNGVKATHIWDGDNIVLELDNAGQVQNKYLRGNGLIAFDNSSVRSYYSRNGHGDVVQLTDATGVVTKNYTYDAFGIETNLMTIDMNPFRYAGEYYDSGGGTYYLRARNYSPNNGRFTTSDIHWNPSNMIYGADGRLSISAISQSSNLYAYCRCNPICYIDPTGDYDREAAIQYALNWYNGRNNEYYSYGQDCANFVSQCLHEGGLRMNSSWYSYKGAFNWNTFWLDVVAAGKAIINLNSQYWYDWDISSTWRLAKDDGSGATIQFNYFSDKSNGYINGDVLTIKTKAQVKTAANDWGIQIGDIMYFCGNDGLAPHHAVIISKIENGEIFYAAHTESRDYAKLSERMGNEQIKIIRIRDEAILGYKP